MGYYIYMAVEINIYKTMKNNENNPSTIYSCKEKQTKKQSKICNSNSFVLFVSYII